MKFWPWRRRQQTVPPNAKAATELKLEPGDRLEYRLYLAAEPSVREVDTPCTLRLKFFTVGDLGLCELSFERPGLVEAPTRPAEADSLCLNGEAIGIPA